jgi:multidrug resistance efflux pump
VTTRAATAFLGKSAWAMLAITCAVSCRHEPTRNTKAVPVRRASLEDVYLLTGEVQAVRTRELTAPRVEGDRCQIRWMAEDGSEVAEGETVVELDNAQVAQSLEEKRLRLAQARIALEGRQSSLAAEIAQKRLERDKARVEAEKAAIEAAVPEELRSRKEWHEKQQALRSAETALKKAQLAFDTAEAGGQADLEALRSAEDKAGRAVRTAEAALADLSIRAPRPGIVLVGRALMDDRPLQVGDNIFSGFRLVSIPEPGAMEVVGYLPEVDEGRVAAGQKVRVVLDTYPLEPMTGRLESVSAVAQDVRYARGFKVRVALDNPDASRLLPGLSARIEVVRRTIPNALIVPRQAVRRDGPRPQVRRHGAKQQTPVEIESCLLLDCVVSGGLAEGDLVVLP